MQENSIPVILDGRATAKVLKKRISLHLEENTSLIQKVGRPRLNVIQVGNCCASAIYIKNKMIASQKVGIDFFLHTFPENASREMIAGKIHQLNEDSKETGIILQLPLPKHLNNDKQWLLNQIHYEKDVDGLSQDNQKFLLSDGEIDDFLLPCTPLGVYGLLKFYKIKVSGMRILMLGRSSLVGLPLGLLFLKENATVTFAHSFSKEISTLVSQSDMVVFATGRKGIIDEKKCFQNIWVIDIGIHRNQNGAVHGDFFNQKNEKNFQKLKGYTPVPGGVGPMTVVSLLYNTYKSWLRKNFQIAYTFKDFIGVFS